MQSLLLKTIHKDTYDLLQELSSKEFLRPFSLAGGTALALLIGHRISVDLDFFTNKEFAGSELLEIIEDHFEVEDCSTSVSTLSLSINFQGSTVKIDFIRHAYPIINPTITTKNGIRLFSIEDIAAMKLNAIANRGAKKDFYDIYALLSKFSLQELIGFFQIKYRTFNSLTVVKSLAYFDDAENDPDPLSLEDITWDTVKTEIKKNLQTSL